MSDRTVIDLELLAEQAEDAIKNAEEGLPDEVFTFVASVTPMINVDLLIVQNNKLLLSWRDDGRNIGWHIPGGIIRFKETINNRIIKTSLNEIGATVSYNAVPIKMSEIFMDYQRRGHFISLLYECSVPDGFEIDNSGLSENDSGYLKWFDYEPANIVEGQKCYKGYISEYMGWENKQS